MCVYGLKPAIFLSERPPSEDVCAESWPHLHTDTPDGFYFFLLSPFTGA